jgi:hypothetical protein
VTAGEATCPKCGRVREPAREDCRACGLVFALWNPEAAPPVVRLDPEAEALWTALCAHWEDAARHEAFVKHCSARGLLAAAGRRYRERLETDPRDAVALRMRDRIVAMATAQLQAVAGVGGARRPTPVTRSRGFWVVLALSAVAAVVGALLYGRAAIP